MLEVEELDLRQVYLFCMFYSKVFLLSTSFKVSWSLSRIVKPPLCYRKEAGGCKDTWGSCTT